MLVCKVHSLGNVSPVCYGNDAYTVYLVYIALVLFQ